MLLITNQVPKSDNIFLIGPMGAGKTTIGKKLANRLGKQFLDSDAELENRTGATIKLIFDVEGEKGFRDREYQLIDELTQQHGIVFATGGGAVLSDKNRNCLIQRGIVIYLSASPKLLMKRTAYDHNRPLLATDDRLGKITSLLVTREPLYRQIADMVVETDKLSIKKIIDRIIEYIKAECVK